MVTGVPPLGTAALRALRHHALDGSAVVEQRTLSGGYSTDNVLLRTERGNAFVLRRYLGDSTCEVESAILALVREQVPVPDVVYTDPSGQLLGEPCVVTRFVEGDTLAQTCTAATCSDGPSLASAIGETLAAIHGFRFPNPGVFQDSTLVPKAVPGPKDLPAFVEQCLSATTATAVLAPGERDALVQLAVRWTPLVETTLAAGVTQLVHLDYVPRNILVRREAGAGWRVSGVLDWEYARASCSLFDVAGMLRFPEDLHPGFEEPFAQGYQRAGGHLPEGWREAIDALDLASLTFLLTKPPAHPLLTKAASALRQRIDRYT